MITIQQIKDWPLGYKSGGFPVTVKTAKKIWEVRAVFYQQATIMDGTGEMLADFKIGRRIPLHSGGEYKIIVAQVQYDEKQGKKLFIDQFAPIVQIGEPELQPFYGQSEREIRGKVKHGLVCAVLTRTDDVDYEALNKHLEYILK